MSRLICKVGTSLDSLTIFNPNDESRPFLISTDIFKVSFNIAGCCSSSNICATLLPAYIQSKSKDIGSYRFLGFLQLRIKGFSGIIPDDAKPAQEDYFAAKPRQIFSLQIQGTFLKEYSSNDLVWAWQADSPIKIPYLFVAFFNVIAPHAMSDLTGDKPYFQSYAVTASSIMQAWEGVQDSFVSNITEDVSSILPPNLNIKTQKKLFSNEENINAAVSNRRKLFVVEENRKSTVFPPNTTVAFETFNGFFDPNTFKVKIPGISYDLNKVLDGQPLRIYLRSCDSKHTFVIVELQLVD